jgi:hypothetical protein
MFVGSTWQQQRRSRAGSHAHCCTPVSRRATHREKPRHPFLLRDELTTRTRSHRRKKRGDQVDSRLPWHSFLRLDEIPKGRVLEL